MKLRKMTIRQAENFAQLAVFGLSLAEFARRINSDCAVIRFGDIECLPEARNLQVDSTVLQIEGEDQYGS